MKHLIKLLLPVIFTTLLFSVNCYAQQQGSIVNINDTIIQTEIVKQTETSASSSLLLTDAEKGTGLHSCYFTWFIWLVLLLLLTAVQTVRHFKVVGIPSIQILFPLGA